VGLFTRVDHQPARRAAGALQSAFPGAIMGVRPPLPYRFANPYIKEHSQFLFCVENDYRSSCLSECPSTSACKVPDSELPGERHFGAATLVGSIYLILKPILLYQVGRLKIDTPTVRPLSLTLISDIYPLPLGNRPCLHPPQV
jgi:hypothetical protein